eukprot:s1032_g4.t1
MLVANQPVTSPVCSVFRVQACSATSSGSAIRQRGLQISRNAAGVAAFALQVVSFRRRQASAVQRPAQGGNRSQSSSATCVAACVVVCGIPGSGKSTLCRLLCAAFESSTWLNQDHFPSGPRARLQFLRGVQNSLDAAMHSRRSALVCVDKVNVQKVHREGFWQQAEEVGWKDFLKCDRTESRETGPAWVNGKSMTMSMDEKDGGSWAEAARARSAPTQQAVTLHEHLQQCPPRTVAGAARGMKHGGLSGLLPSRHGSEPALRERSTFWGQPGSRCVTAESMTSFYVANRLARSIIESGLTEAKRQSDATSALSEDPPTTGTWTSEVMRVLPGSQLASPETTPLPSPSVGQETPPETAASDTQQSDPEAIIHDSWAEKVLQQLSKEASFTKTLPHRDGVDISPSEIAALFGFDLLHGSEAQPLGKQQMRKGMPSIPKLDLTRLTRDEDEDDEDFENKAATLPPSNVASGSEIAWEQEQHSAHNMRQASSNQHGKSGNSTTKNSMSGIKVSRNVQDMDKPKPDEKQQNWSTHQAEEVCGEGHSGVVRF